MTKIKCVWFNGKKSETVVMDDTKAVEAMEKHRKDRREYHERMGKWPDYVHGVIR